MTMGWPPSTLSTFFEPSTRITISLRRPIALVNPSTKSDQAQGGRRRSGSVFLCHSSVDQKFVRRLASDLVKLDVRVWYSEWDMRPGDSLHESIGKALTRSHFVCVVISPDAVKSRWCKEELYQALTQEKAGKARVVPIVLRKAALPPFLQDRLTLNVRDGYFVVLTKLVALVRGTLDTMGVLTRVASKPPRRLSTVKDIVDETDELDWLNVGSENWRTMMEIMRSANIPMGRRDVITVRVPGRRRAFR